MPDLAFIEYLSSLTGLSSDLAAALHAQLNQETYRNHQVFHSEGQAENRLWFLEEGLVRSYYFDPAGKEHTLQFFSTGEVIFSWHGFYQERTDFYLEALEPSKLWALGYNALNSLCEAFPELVDIAKVIARRRFHTDTFYSRLMTLGAEERYRQFRNLHPDIFRRIPVRLIATYLNMTRENLSKLITGDLR